MEMFLIVAGAVGIFVLFKLAGELFRAFLPDPEGN